MNINLIRNFRQFLTASLKMTSKLTIETVKQNAEVAKRTIVELRNELNNLNAEYNNLRAEQLREENAKLLIAVEQARKNLVDLEIANDVKQIPVPNRTSYKIDALATGESAQTVSELVKAEAAPTPNVKDSKPKKEKKPKETKEKSSEDTNIPIDVGRLDLRIAKVEDVQRHPDADTLYVLKINCGEDKPRTVCSGLVKRVPIDELKDRLVVLLCNLKPVKMRGITSEAMVMCASSPECVEVLIPPKDVVQGDLVECSGYIRRPDTVMNPKKKIFETVVPDLHTNENLEACYKGIPFTVPGKGTILAKTLKNVAVK
ncbi:hypothetical protein AMK59_8315 [Oryctes borbonicus]|uniref:tRNA-binding domain-containing protein n=1 Tax=Oryctes borbonicus TaxID=1629725 RepID=A0A0T6AUI3_9SCAR|nr:hypothetical protein AMK59_8315 [Oryctes borbonicus]